MKVAFLGLGVMGGPMAGHLANAGHRVSVYNRTRARAEAWTSAHPGSIAETPAEAARGAELVLACVGNDDDVRAVTLAPGGAFETLGPQAVFVDHTTASAALARELDTAASSRGAGFLDAPVSGGQSGAEQGSLTVMLGGEAAAFERARPALAAYARKLVHVGPAGSGQLAKMVNQICIAGTLQGLAEGLHFAERAGLDALTVVDAISQGAAQSWQLDNRAGTMIEGEYDFGFAVEWMRKDLSLALDEARRNGAQLQIAALVNQLYAEVEALGGKRWDTSSLLARLSKRTPER
jgi:3-hydroxyisobutyrate dehydrogenase